MSTITRERIEQLANGNNICKVTREERIELARIALASLEANGTIGNEGTITATQFNPVSDLYGLTSPTGGETSFTFDAVEARDFIDGGWSCQEYVELGRFQEAVSGNSPVIPDGWVLVPIEPTYQMCEAMGLQWESPRFPDRYKAMLAAVKK
ncbi:Uncharacterised protein [Enterobacter hormaechei]|uniref:hypothetical protein n=1 Tax=Enterobacter hormaechei TaxID=158836 RepID=UPI000795D69B|nr:hypothetical protein [Enterobacter hormaechei]CZY29315.1 Uncharacterised protein [Enterobacter hormaechei]